MDFLPALFFEALQLRVVLAMHESDLALQLGETAVTSLVERTVFQCLAHRAIRFALMPAIAKAALLRHFRNIVERVLQALLPLLFGLPQAPAELWWGGTSPYIKCDIDVPVARFGLFNPS